MTVSTPLIAHNCEWVQGVHMMTMYTICWTEDSNQITCRDKTASGYDLCLSLRTPNAPTKEACVNEKHEGQEANDVIPIQWLAYLDKGIVPYGVDIPVESQTEQRSKEATKDHPSG